MCFSLEKMRVQETLRVSQNINSFVKNVRLLVVREESRFLGDRRNFECAFYFRAKEPRNKCNARFNVCRSTRGKEYR